MPMSGETSSNTSQLERRHLTVLECDLVGSTALANKLDPEELRDLVLAYQDCVLSLIKKNNGFFVQFAGDAIWVYFGYPYAHEDDACQAIRTGLEIAKAVTSIGIYNEPLNVRVGIASGLCVVGNMRHSTKVDDTRNQITALGRPPNLASRLQTLVAAGCVAVSDETRALTGNIFDFEDLGLHNIKGFPDKTKVWRVEKENANQNRFLALRSGIQTRLVGRESELNCLSELWTGVCLGKGRVIFIYGEPGIGKSRLVTELAETTLGVRSGRWWFQCGEYLQGSAFAPIISQFQTLAEIINEDDALTRFDKLSESFPMLAMHELHLLAELLLIDGDFKSKISKSKRREKLYELLIKQIKRDANKTPILVVFEDIHWVDASTHEFISYLASAIENLPVFLVITSRNTNDQVKPNINLSYSHELRVGQLKRDDCFELLKSLSEKTDLPSNLSKQIVEQTDGVPLFIEDLTISLLQSPSYSNCFSNNEKITVPNKLSEHLMSRIDKLGESKKVAQIGSVIGKEFSSPMLQAVSNLSPTEIETGIRSLIESGIVIPSTKLGESIYLFKHAMIRDAAYESLLITDRIEFHSRIASWFELEESSWRQILPESIAYHFELAGKNRLSVKYWLKAGQLSNNQSNYVEALIHLGNAQRLIDNLEKTPTRDRSELDVIIALGVAFAGVGGISGKTPGKIYDKAISLCEALDYPAETISVLAGAGSLHFIRANYNLSLKIAEQSIELASKIRDSSGTIIGKRIIGAVQCIKGDFTNAIDSLVNVLDLYDSNPTTQQNLALSYALDHKTTALCYMALTYLALSKIDTALKVSHQSVCHSDLIDLHSLNCSLSYQAAVFHLRNDPPELIYKIASRSLKLADEEGYASWLGMSRLLLGDAMVQLGNHEEGSKYIAQGVLEHKDVMAQTFLPLAQSIQAKGYLLTGNYDKSLTLLWEAESLSYETDQKWYLPEIQRLYAEALLGLGETESANKYYKKAWNTANEINAKFWKLKIAYSMASHKNYALEHRNTLLLLTEAIDSIEEGFTSSFVIQAMGLVKSNKQT
jgi:class 3 adenylate cyclase/tetratricopeptide (TPR) repeat protein